MNTCSPSARILTAFIGLASFILASPVNADEQDFAHALALLSQAKMEAIRLREDANQMQNFILNEVTWDTHAVYARMLADDIVEMRETIDQLDKLGGGVSDWQRTAINQINPLLRELATTTTRIIETTDEKPFDRTQYNDYLEANYDCSKHLAALLSESVRYGKTKNRPEKIAEKLQNERKSK